MIKAEQGDLLRIAGFNYPAMVVNNNFFNESGKAIVCPMIKNTIEGPLHIRLNDCALDGFVLCEQVRFVDLSARRYSKITETKNHDIVNISDAIMGMFDYQVI